MCFSSDGVMTREISGDGVTLLGSAPANLPARSQGAFSLISARSPPFLSQSRLAAFERQYSDIFGILFSIYASIPPTGWVHRSIDILEK